LQAADLQLIDTHANPQTRNLYQNLYEVGQEHVLFGHQNTTAYGHDWVGDEGTSDVKAVTGSYPAVYGWDIMDLDRAGDATYGYNRKDLKRWVTEAYERGGVSTFSWHMPNPVTGESFYDTTPAVSTILPGGENHEGFKHDLDDVAEFFHSVEPVPIIFRPFHEHNGDWFWWCKGSTSEEDYIALWRFTIDYLRHEKGVHNVIYAFSPDRSRLGMEDAKDGYFWGYPGDDYVDIIGLDNYWDVGHPANEKSADDSRALFVESLELIVDIADAKHKVPALTETGNDTLKVDNWYTDILLAGLDANEKTRRIAYVQVWRNANRELEGKEHFYAPYPGQSQADDFIEFMNSDLILFENELPDLYHQP